MPKMAFPPPGKTSSPGAPSRARFGEVQVGMSYTLASVLLGSIQLSIWSQPSQRYGMYVTIDPSKMA